MQNFLSTTTSPKLISMSTSIRNRMGLICARLNQTILKIGLPQHAQTPMTQHLEPHPLLKGTTHKSKIERFQAMVKPIKKGRNSLIQYIKHYKATFT